VKLLELNKSERRIAASKPAVKCEDTIGKRNGAVGEADVVADHVDSTSREHICIHARCLERQGFAGFPDFSSGHWRGAWASRSTERVIVVHQHGGGLAT
jgi:hypothetical protein